MDAGYPAGSAVLLGCPRWEWRCYENRDIPDMTTYKATRMAFDSLLYPYRDPEKMF